MVYARMPPKSRLSVAHNRQKLLPVPHRKKLLSTIQSNGQSIGSKIFSDRSVMPITMHKMLFIMASLVMFLSACSTTPVSQRHAVESRDVPVSSPTTESAKTSPVPSQQANPQAMPLPPDKSTGTDIPATIPVPAPTNPAGVIK